MVNEQVVQQPQTEYGFVSTTPSNGQVTIYRPDQCDVGLNREHMEAIHTCDHSRYQFVDQVSDHYVSHEAAHHEANLCHLNYLPDSSNRSSTSYIVDEGNKLRFHDQSSGHNPVQNGYIASQATSGCWHNQADDSIKFAPLTGSMNHSSEHAAINDIEAPASKDELIWHNCKPTQNQVDNNSIRSISRSSGSATGKAPPEKIIQRVKANKKERRRTQSINQAFNELRRHIPDVPSDTKLSKIKTLRLAISYISHLSLTLQGEPNNSNNNQRRNKTATTENPGNNRPGDASLGNNHLVELVSSKAKQSQQLKCYLSDGVSKLVVHPQPKTPKDRKHRTGWPEIVWKLSPGDLCGADNKTIGASKARLTEMTVRAKNK